MRRADDDVPCVAIWVLVVKLADDDVLSGTI